MTNEEKYKTPAERNEAFYSFCKSVDTCCACQLINKSHTLQCQFAWLALEAEEELLPCPFCGGKAKFHEERGTFDVDGSKLLTVHYEVYCSRCFAQTSSIAGGDKNMVIERWNRRAK